MIEKWGIIGNCAQRYAKKVVAYKYFCKKTAFEKHIRSDAITNNWQLYPFILAKKRIVA